MPKRLVRFRPIADVHAFDMLVLFWGARLMAQIATAPGLKIDSTCDEIVIHVDRKSAGPLLSVLLNSKFGYEPRLEFLTNPYVNHLIEALMTVQDRARFSAETFDPHGMARVRDEVRRCAETEGLGPRSEAELSWLARFPWSLNDAP